MQRRKFIWTMALLGLSACRDQSALEMMAGRNSDEEDLSEAERLGILRMREEEKLARDVYITLGQIWKQDAFGVIQISEQGHMNAMERLVENYDLTDPAQDQLGRFTDPTLQSLYDQLAAQGEDSPVAALQVGMTVEDLDIYDLDRLLAQNDQDDVAQVLSHLRAGSVAHLRRFYVDLTNLGGSYQPQYLDQATYLALLQGL